jgi:hypothetical protein
MSPFQSGGLPKCDFGAAWADALDRRETGWPCSSGVFLQSWIDLNCSFAKAGLMPHMLSDRLGQ